MDPSSFFHHLRKAPLTNIADPNTDLPPPPPYTPSPASHTIPLTPPSYKTKHSVALLPEEDPELTDMSDTDSEAEAEDNYLHPPAPRTLHLTVHNPTIVRGSNNRLTGPANEQVRSAVSAAVTQAMQTGGRRDRWGDVHLTVNCGFTIEGHNNTVVLGAPPPQMPVRPMTPAPMAQPAGGLAQMQPAQAPRAHPPAMPPQMHTAQTAQAAQPPHPPPTGPHSHQSNLDLVARLRQQAQAGLSSNPTAVHSAAAPITPGTPGTLVYPPKITSTAGGNTAGGAQRKRPRYEYDGEGEDEGREAKRR